MASTLPTSTVGFQVRNVHFLLCNSYFRGFKKSRGDLWVVKTGSKVVLIGGADNKV